MENREPQPRDRREKYSLLRTNRWSIGVAIVLLVFGGIITSYKHQQAAVINHLMENQRAFAATTTQMQSQLSNITAKLEEMSAAQIVAAERAKAQETRIAQPATAHHEPAKASATNDERLNQIEGRLDQQQNQLNQTDESLAKTRSDLEGTLNSNYEELNGSIAKTHEQLLALERRGERNYFEFDLSKGTQFQRSGPIMLSLRKSDSKHQTFDLAIIASDQLLKKKTVNLYEPIWIAETAGSQPLQVVVNHISKDLVHGYVSAPKYSQPNLVSNEASPSPNTNASTQ